MCTPIAVGLITAGVGAAQSVASYSAAQQQTATANENALKQATVQEQNATITANNAAAQSKMVQENAENSVEAWKNQQALITQREMQEQDALSQKKTQQNIAEAQSEAETAVSGAASGVAGISLDNLLGDVSRRAATNRSTLQDNADMVIAQLRQQRTSANTDAESHINSVTAPSAPAVPELPTLASSPSALSLVAGLGSSGIEGYNSYVKAKNALLP